MTHPTLTGWKLVPVKATREMLEAGVRAGVNATPKPWCPKTWAAMLATAPAAPMPSSEVLCKFDVMSPEQERLAIEFCNEIAGPKGSPSRLPDPVRLLEMAEALYKAELEFHAALSKGKDL